MAKYQQIKQRIGFNWIRGRSGNTYLCPLGTFAPGETPSEEDLKRLCVNESFDPNNQ